MKYFISDLHIYHQNILNWAPARSLWKTVEEMNEGLIECWNSVVKADDEVYNLGDLAFQPNKKRDEINTVLKRLNGKHILIKGNHDDRKNIEKFENIAEFHHELVLNLQGIDFLLKHYPYEHAMRPKDVVERPDCFTNARYDEKTCFAMKKHCLNTGFDAWGRMISENEVIEIHNKTNAFTENFEQYNELNTSRIKVDN